MANEISLKNISQIINGNEELIKKLIKANSNGSQHSKYDNSRPFRNGKDLLNIMHGKRIALKKGLNKL